MNTDDSIGVALFTVGIAAVVFLSQQPKEIPDTSLAPVVASVDPAILSRFIPGVPPGAPTPPSGTIHIIGSNFTNPSTVIFENSLSNGTVIQNTLRPATPNDIYVDIFMDVPDGDYMVSVRTHVGLSGSVPLTITTVAGA